MADSRETLSEKIQECKKFFQEIVIEFLSENKEVQERMEYFQSLGLRPYLSSFTDLKFEMPDPELVKKEDITTDVLRMMSPTSDLTQ